MTSSDMRQHQVRGGAVSMWNNSNVFRILRLALLTAVSVLVLAIILMAATPFAPSISILAPHGSGGITPSSATGNGTGFACVDAALNITWYQQGVPLAPTPLPPSHGASDGEAIIELFHTLGLSTIWTSIANITIEGDSGEPEGMVRLGDDRFVVSAGEWLERTQKYEGGAIINGTDRSPGSGFAHLLVYDGQGKRIADATITRQGTHEYHNGGIDYDGEFIWGAIGQYRPNTTGYAYKADPTTLRPQPVVHYADHLGGIVHDTRDNLITCLNWGARNASTFDLNELTSIDTTSTPDSPCGVPLPPKRVSRNPTYFIDYQDCKWLGHSARYDDKSVMLCSGVGTVGGYHLGGLALVDVATMVPLAEVPITLESARGTRMTQNPFDVSVVEGRLRLYWMPDQHESTVYVYEARPDSPFQYGGGTRG